MAEKSINKRMVIKCFSKSPEAEAFVNEKHISRDDILSFGPSNKGDYMLVYFEIED